MKIISVLTLPCLILSLLPVNDAQAADVGPPRPPAAEQSNVPDLFRQASLTVLARRAIRPTPITTVSVFEDSTLFKIESVRYSSDDMVAGALLAIPKTGKPPYPAVVICHGYYPPASYRQGLGTLDTIEALSSEGFVVFAPDYRGYAPSEGQHSYPYLGEIMDIAQGFVSLSMHPKVDARRIGIIGYSMGGGYALQAAEILGARVKTFVNYYGQLGGFFMRDDELGMLLEQGMDFPTAEAVFKSRSPLYHLDLLQAPVLIFHGQNDRTVSVVQSLALKSELTRRGLPVEFVAFPEYGHAFGDSFRNNSWHKLVAHLKSRLSK